MDIRVQELLDKIKREGTDKAKSEAAKIIADAEAKSKTIISEAEKNAQAIIDKAKSDAKRSEEAGNAAITQAARDMSLAFRQEIGKILTTIVKADVKTALDADVIKNSLPAILEAMSKTQDNALTVILSESDLKKLESFFNSKLADKLKAGLVIKPHKDSTSGFKIIEKDGAAYYDYSAEAVADMLSSYLNTGLAELCRKAIV